MVSVVINVYSLLVCIVCFDVVVIIRFVKHDRCSREVIKVAVY